MNDDCTQPQPSVEQDRRGSSASMMTATTTSANQEIGRSSSPGCALRSPWSLLCSINYPRVWWIWLRSAAAILDFLAATWPMRSRYSSSTLTKPAIRPICRAIATWSTVSYAYVQARPSSSVTDGISWLPSTRAYPTASTPPWPWASWWRSMGIPWS